MNTKYPNWAFSFFFFLHKFYQDATIHLTATGCEKISHIIQQRLLSSKNALKKRYFNKSRILHLKVKVRKKN